MVYDHGVRPLWVIQRNLGNTDDCQRVIEACHEDGCDVQAVDVVPFSDDLPEVPGDRPTVFYGATGFINRVHLRGSWRPGAFYDAEAFRYSRYIREYGELVLNADAELTTIGDYNPTDFPYANENLDDFIRPDRDLKEFAGAVIRRGDFAQWRSRIIGLSLHEDLEVDESCPIIVAEPVGIPDEWRTFIVDGQVVAGSHYRTYQRLDVVPGVPDDVREFAENAARIWAPAPVFTMDIARSGEGLYILELGCFNSSGFYASDIKALIFAINSHIRDEPKYHS